MRRTVACCLAFAGSCFVVWACATGALPIDNTDVPETGTPPDSGKVQVDAGCPQFNTDNDPKHCGSCSKACTALQVCAAGVCKAACDLPTVKCTSSDGGGGGCVDPATDPMNCGSCNNKCPVVDAGSVPADNGNDAGINFGDAGFDAGIPPKAGTATCTSSKCGVSCPASLTGCADNICYDTMNNHDHCGNCMTACAMDIEWCTAGHCCAGGSQYCGGMCADTQSDPKNCGGCGKVCPMNAQTCSGGTCVACDTNTDVLYNGKCYYLDGSGGACDIGFSRGSNATMAAILATNVNAYAGKNYKHKVSGNCCMWTSDASEVYGMAGHCNANGPFSNGEPVVNGTGCNGAKNFGPDQLTFCGAN